MSLKSKVKFLAKFSSSSLSESVTGESLSVVGEGPASILADNSGYRMTRDQYLLLTDISANITSSFTLGFFLNPINEGRVKSGSSTLPTKVSVLDFGVGTGEGSNFEMTRKSLVVHEECEEDGENNKLRFILHDSSGNVVYESLTPTYETGKRHHFWFVYDGSGGNVIVYVDGNIVTPSTTGSIPASVGVSTAALAINRYVVNDSQLINSRALIDDVVLFNTTESDINDVQLVANNSIDYLVDNDFNHVEELDFGLFFDDPSAIRTTDATADGSSLITTRTDGVLAEGSRLLWEVRKDFSDSNELNGLETIADSATIERRLLKLSGMAEL